MAQTIVVRGRVVGSRTIEVDEALPADSNEVEVVLHVGTSKPGTGDPARLLEYLQSLPPGTRSKEDIDRQIEEDRGSWDA